jgi:hypothetical protein
MPWKESSVMEERRRMARPKRFEPPTPRFVVCGQSLILLHTVSNPAEIYAIASAWLQVILA